MSRFSRAASAIASMTLSALASTGVAAHRPGPSVPLCSRQISFKASYLAPTHKGDTPGYLFRIENHTSTRIKLIQPVPSSAHWYAHVGAKWLWRASSGSGGSYVDAINERGPLFAYQPTYQAADPQYIIIPAHGKYEWTSGDRDNPALAYRPGCEHCNYPGEYKYKAVFAYAYMPPAGQHIAGLLHCGLRTKLVDMPPKPADKESH